MTMTVVDRRDSELATDSGRVFARELVLDDGRLVRYSVPTANQVSSLSDAWQADVLRRK